MTLFPKPTVPIAKTQQKTCSARHIHPLLGNEEVRPVNRKRSRLKIRATTFLLLVVTLLAMPTWARIRRQHARPAAPADAAHISALATANRFMHAWQAGDLESGMALISDGIRHSESADRLEQLFSSTSERAFEIGAGRASHGRYTFPLVLLALKGDHLARRSSEITVVNAGKNDWVVDKLP